MKPVTLAARLAGVLLLAALLLVSLGAAAPAATDGSPFFHPDETALEKWVGDYEQAPPAPISAPSRTRAVTEPSSKSLLALLPYVPAERDQGAAGTCWVWAGTGILELSQLLSAGIHDRLSIQWFDSNYNGGAGADWAGNGGTLSEFARFYEEERMTVPWSNANASYADGSSRSVIEERALVPASSIAETPNHTLAAVEEQRIVTRGVGQAQAIANIRAQIDQFRPVFVGLTYPNRSAVSDFLSLWYSGGESAVWDPSPYDDAAWDPGEGAAHAVLCVGYDTTDPEHPYWIMLNSMGTANGQRPSGTFRMAMDLDYDAIYDHSYPVYPSQWETLVSSFVVPTPTPTSGVVPFPGQANKPTDPDGDGLYEDLNGNGRADFADVVLLFNELAWWAENEPIAAFDFNGNGRADFADVVSLFNRL